MTNQEKMEMLEEIMDVEQGTLKIGDALGDYEEWDSLSILAYITMMSERFGKSVEGKQIKEFVTVEDALRLME